jgi:hypothetical protein
MSIGAGDPPPLEQPATSNNTTPKRRITRARSLVDDAL